jgi:hypothetical protein
MPESHHDLPLASARPTPEPRRTPTDVPTERVARRQAQTPDAPPVVEVTYDENEIAARKVNPYGKPTHAPHRMGPVLKGLIALAVIAILAIGLSVPLFMVVVLAIPMLLFFIPPLVAVWRTRKQERDEELRTAVSRDPEHGGAYPRSRARQV